MDIMIWFRLLATSNMTMAPKGIDEELRYTDEVNINSKERKRNGDYECRELGKMT